MWITTKEMCTEWGGKSEELERQKKRQRLIKLPFNYCSLAMVPFKDPYCTTDGLTFDLLNIVPFLRKHGKHPVTGEDLQQKDLIKLNFHKNEKGEYHCPVTFKQFNENSHIIAVAETGNVFSFDAYKELNKEPKFYFDLLSNEKFNPKNLVTVQDPKCPGRSLNLNKIFQEGDKKEDRIQETGTSQRIFEQLKKNDTSLFAEYESKMGPAKRAKLLHDENVTKLEAKLLAAKEPLLEDLRICPELFLNLRRLQGRDKSIRYTDGKQGAGFTSTRMTMITDKTFKELPANDMRREYWDVVRSK